MSSRWLKWVLLGIYLVLVGLSLLGLFGGGALDIIAGVCAVIAGVLFIIYR